MGSGTRNVSDNEHDDTAQVYSTVSHTASDNAAALRSNLSETVDPKDGTSLIDKGVNEPVNEVNENEENDKQANTADDNEDKNKDQDDKQDQEQKSAELKVDEAK